MTAALLCAPSAGADEAASSRPKRQRPVVVAFTDLDSAGLGQTVLAEISTGSAYRLLPIGALAPLLRQRDADEALITQADTLREEARQALLALDHATAQGKLDAALELMQRSFVRFYAPTQLAQLRLVRGVTALRASRPDLARQEFVKARQLDASLEPDAHYSPQVRSAYAQAIQSIPPLPAPTPEQISAVVKQVQTAKLALVLMVQQPDARHKLAQALIFDPAQARYTTVESVPLPSDSAAAEQKARALGRRIGRQLSRRLRPAPPAALASTQPGVQPDGQTGNPWYKRWYVWVAVGAVVAGVATVIPFAAQRDVVELEVDWRGAQ